MKKIFILAALVALVGNSCDGKKGDQGAATCAPPKLGSTMGTIYQVSSGCTKGADLEHFRIEGLTLKEGQRVVLYYNATDTSGRAVKSAVSVTITSNGNITVDNNIDFSSSSGRRPKIVGRITGNIVNRTACFDFHNDGGNLHFIAWQDKNCDQSYSGNAGTTIANDKTMGPFKENAKKMYYRFGIGAKATLIVVKGAIFKE